MSDHIIFIIDKSSSVSLYEKQYLETVNNIIQTQKYFNPNSLLTCILFNDYIQYLYINLPLNKFETPININDLRPQGLTAFYDNISIIISKLLDLYKNQQSYKTPPLVIILTDGEDTCSKSTENQASLQIHLAKKEGWQFIYLGVNEKSMRIGREIGCDTCIMYSCSLKGFSKVPEIMNKLLKNKIVPVLDIDISDLTESLSNTKIN